MKCTSHSPQYITNMWLQVCCLTLIIQFNTSYSFAHSWIVSISAVYHKQFNLTSVISLTQLNGRTVLFLTIQFSKSHLLEHSLNVYLTNRKDPIKCYHSRPQCIWEQWQWRCTQHFLKLQRYCGLTIRLFSVISKTFWGVGAYPSEEKALVYLFYRSSQLGWWFQLIRPNSNTSSSSSSWRAASTDIPDPLSPLFPIVHRLWLVFRATSRILA